MASENPETLVQEPPRPRILVAEDNPSNYKLVEVLLRNFYTLIHAWDGVEAVRLFREQGAELILMDISMPELDGYGALSQIRAFAPEVPVIALTAFAFESDRQRMFQAGFDDCLAKPLRAGELRAKIAAFLSRKSPNL